jgi:hypothetical protein
MTDLAGWQPDPYDAAALEHGPHRIVYVEAQHVWHATVRLNPSESVARTFPTLGAAVAWADQQIAALG